MNKIFHISKIVWLILSAMLFLLSVFGWINSNISHKYEVEEWGSQTMTAEAIVRAKWIDEEITVSKYCAIIFGINTLMIAGIIFTKNSNSTNSSVNRT